ncbi:MAG: hypothetical protein LAT83_07645 [Kiritimatiellae bacterium]|nr:hypothetical protein [Kiritimatiellia bacterium]
MTTLKNLKFTPYLILSWVSVVVAAVFILTADAPWTSRAAMGVALGIWSAFMYRLKAFVPLVALLMVFAARGSGGVPSVTGEPLMLGGVVLGMTGLGLRLVRGDLYSALMSGVLWAGMVLLIPGLAPLGVLGLLAMAMLHAEHGRKVFFPGLLIMIGGLAYALLSGNLPEDLIRYADPESYSELGQAFLELFESPSLWVAVPLVGVFELANGHPQNPKRGFQHFPYFGGLLCFLFLPPETALGLLYFIAWPLSAVMLTRWMLAFPIVRKHVDSPLSPPAHPLPDNSWHTTLTVVLAGTLAWLAWTNGLETFRTNEPVTQVEAALFAGEPAHPLYATLEAWLDTTRFSPGFWNRILSGLGFVLGLGMTVRMLSRQIGVKFALAALILFVSIPGFGANLFSAGSGSMAIWLILMGLSAVILEEDQTSWMRGGFLLGLGVWLHPVWFLPTLGISIGVFEVFRARSNRVLMGQGAGLALGLVVMLFWDAAWVASLFSSAFSRTVPLEDAAIGGGVLYASCVFLGGLAAVIFFGATRRGVGWWAFLFALPAALAAHFFFEEPARALAPFFVLGCMGFVRLPGLMDVRHPSVYQTVLTAQLLLWLPLHLSQYLLGL